MSVLVFLFSVLCVFMISGGIGALFDDTDLAVPWVVSSLLASVAITLLEKYI